MEHRSDGTCCAGAAPVRLQHDLFNRLRCRPYYSPDDYARALAAHEGETVRVLHRFESNGLPTGYTVELPNGRAFHVPSLYADEIA